jgi:cellulose synthase (UDP-forming)
MPNLDPAFNQRWLAAIPLRSIARGMWILLPIAVVITSSIALTLSICSQNQNLGELIGRSLAGLLNPWDWIKVPITDNLGLLFLPSLLCLLIVRSIRVMSPTPKPWSRGIIIAMILALTLRYFFWRSLETLNFTNFWNGFFSLLLWSLEMVSLLGGSVLLALSFRLKDRQKEADRYSQAVIEKSYLPSVDILIPTYDEPEFILRRTMIGVQAIDYPNKSIYILDDTKRKNIENLAIELGCHYITRPNSHHAKAGNLNYALASTDGELIAVFDADFIPLTNFLERTVGFFQNPKIALVQTPQSFYNADPIAYNLGLGDVVLPEEEVFYRYIQPMKDSIGGVVCAGTSFVMRREPLEKIGYFNTESITEDYFTGIELTARGYEAIYLDQKLSAGLAAESLSTYLLQRLRWGRGTLQAFFIQANPFTIRTLSFRQRLCHFEGIVSWFTPIARLFFLVFPLLYAFLNILPIQVTSDEVIYIFLPYYITQLNSFYWLNKRSRSIIFSEIFHIIPCFPIAINVIKTLMNPFGSEFTVTPKGIVQDRYVYNWSLAWPLLVLFLVTFLGIIWNLSHPRLESNQVNFVLIWGSYNLLIILLALLALLETPRLGESRLLAIETPIELTLSSARSIPGKSVRLSETIAEIAVNEPLPLEEMVIVELVGENIQIAGQIIRSERHRKVWKAIVRLDTLERTRQEQLIEFLFCRPDRWPERETPGEWQSLWLLVGSFARAISTNWRSSQQKR